MNKEQLISKGKELILQDMAKKVIPTNAQSFVDLHDYVDTNAYISNNFKEEYNNEVKMFNEVSDALDKWLKGRSHKSDLNKVLFYDDELHDGHVLFWVHGYQYSADIEVQRHTRERNVSFNGFNDEITRTTTRDNYFMPSNIQPTYDENGDSHGKNLENKTEILIQLELKLNQ